MIDYALAISDIEEIFGDSGGIFFSKKVGYYEVRVFMQNGEVQIKELLNGAVFKYCTVCTIEELKLNLSRIKNSLESRGWNQ